MRFRVLVEPGLKTTEATFRDAVLQILCFRAGWTRSGVVRFVHDRHGPLLIALRSPDSTQRRCMQLIGLSVNRIYSCAGWREVVLNSARWFTGAPPGHWPGPVVQYRRMLVNHEVGHALGLGHQTCTRRGALAPVMMQQSKGLTSPSGKTCRPSSWPLPEELARLRRVVG